jgi:hypothetical protein
MPEYITYLSLTTNAVMLAGLLAMRKQIQNLQTSLDLALEIMEAQDATNQTTTV